jgi:hypothetical protein
MGEEITDAALSALLAAIAEVVLDPAERARRWARLQKIAPRTATAIGSLIVAEGNHALDIAEGRQS